MIHCMGSKVPIAMSGFTSDSQTRKKECFRLSSTQRLLSNTARVSCKLISVAFELIVVTGTTTTWFGINPSIFILVCTAAGKCLFFFFPPFVLYLEDHNCVLQGTRVQLCLYDRRFGDWHLPPHDSSDRTRTELGHLPSTEIRWQKGAHHGKLTHLWFCLWHPPCRRVGSHDQSVKLEWVIGGPMPRKTPSGVEAVRSIIPILV